MAVGIAIFGIYQSHQSAQGTNKFPVLLLNPLPDLLQDTKIDLHPVAPCHFAGIQGFVSGIQQ